MTEVIRVVYGKILLVSSNDRAGFFEKPNQFFIVRVGNRQVMRPKWMWHFFQAPSAGIASTNRFKFNEQNVSISSLPQPSSGAQSGGSATDDGDFTAC
jgi:hypothetical protein